MTKHVKIGTSPSSADDTRNKRLTDLVKAALDYRNVSTPIADGVCASLYSVLRWQCRPWIRALSRARNPQFSQPVKSVKTLETLSQQERISARLTPALLTFGWILPVVLSGCAYESRAFDAEQASLANVSGEKINHMVRLQKNRDAPAKSFQSSSALLAREPIRTAIYALQLSDAYKRLGDEAARNRDTSAAALIAVAGGAALGSAATISGTDLALVLAGGALIYEGVKYVNPNSASQAFYVASESMACASTAIASHVPRELQQDFQVTTLALWYIRKIEVLLRTTLKRDVPEWKDLLAAMGVSPAPIGSAVNKFAAPSTSVDVAALETDLEKCLRPPVSGDNDKEGA